MEGLLTRGGGGRRQLGPLLGGCGPLQRCFGTIVRDVAQIGFRILVFCFSSFLSFSSLLSFAYFACCSYLSPWKGEFRVQRGSLSPSAKNKVIQ